MGVEKLTLCPWIRASRDAIFHSISVLSIEVGAFGPSTTDSGGCVWACAFLCLHV